MNFAQKLPAYVIGGGLLIGAVVAIGLWYLALFALAAIIFIVLWLVQIILLLVCVLIIMNHLSISFLVEV